MVIPPNSFTGFGDISSFHASVPLSSDPQSNKCQRKDADDEIYMTEREKYNATIKDIIEIYGQGRPVLIGTESLEISEKLARILKQ